jgi:hypothetical protein
MPFLLLTIHSPSGISHLQDPSGVLDILGPLKSAMQRLMRG